MELGRGCGAGRGQLKGGRIHWHIIRTVRGRGIWDNSVATVVACSSRLQSGCVLLKVKVAVDACGMGL